MGQPDPKQIRIAQHLPAADVPTPAEPEPAATRKSPTRLTSVQFYQACELMKRDRHWYTDTQPTHQQAAEDLSRKLGVAVSATTIGDMIEATGVNWRPKTVRGHATDQAIKSNANRTLATALRTLYRKLGEDVPSSLEDLHRYYAGPRDATAEANGQHIKED